jgi:hypothetical protein
MALGNHNIERAPARMPPGSVGENLGDFTERDGFEGRRSK